MIVYMILRSICDCVCDIYLMEKMGKEKRGEEREDGGGG
jgi:hypothetical protein